MPLLAPRVELHIYNVGCRLTNCLFMFVVINMLVEKNKETVVCVCVCAVHVTCNLSWAWELSL